MRANCGTGPRRRHGRGWRRCRNHGRRRGGRRLLDRLYLTKELVQIVRHGLGASDGVPAIAATAWSDAAVPQRERCASWARRRGEGRAGGLKRRSGDWGPKNLPPWSVAGFPRAQAGWQGVLTAVWHRGSAALPRRGGSLAVNTAEPTAHVRTVRACAFLAPALRRRASGMMTLAAAGCVPGIGPHVDAVYRACSRAARRRRRSAS